MYDREKQQGIISENTHELIQIYSERLIQNDVPVIFNLRHLRKLLQIHKTQQSEYFGAGKSNLYRRFKIPKKAGGFRTIEAPVQELKIRQLWIKQNILDKVHVSEYAKGFKKDTSIYHNAIQHVNKELIINVDIEDFFPSITYRKVYRIFSYLGYTNQVAHLLTKLCTNDQNVIPQGAPTSPVISNIVLIKMDKRLGELAKTARCSYTRYADDITFSGDKSIKFLLPIVCKIIEEEGYKVNKDKTRLQYSNQRQEVTGLVVNKKVSLSKATIKEIENAIYYCQKYGVQEHMKKIQCQKNFYKEHLYGIAYFCKMIDKAKGEKYLQELDKIEWLY